MSLETKRIKELFGYARTLTKEQGVGVMAGRAVGFFKRRFFGKKARYLPAKQTLDTQRADAGQNAKNCPAISILTPLYNTPPHVLWLALIDPRSVMMTFWARGKRFIN